LSIPQAVEKAIGGKRILITGAGGSIGSALARAVGQLHPEHLVLLDNSERNLNDVTASIASTFDEPSFTAVLGSVGDSELLRTLFERHRPTIVIHAAAFKHVPLLETNPLAALQNNAIATYSLAKLSRETSASNLVLLSTDKAVNPISIMGASKRLGELALAQFGGAHTRMAAVRLGNVLGTEGSVMPLFLGQISRGGPVTVTHPDATRYFFGMDQAVELILLAVAENTSGVFVPRINEPVNIRQMAIQLIKNSKAENHNEIEIVFSGLRPGDKLSEEFLYENEKSVPTNDPRLLKLMSNADISDNFETGMAHLSERVNEHDITGALDVLRQLVPEYRPSETVTRLSEGLPV